MSLLSVSQSLADGRRGADLEAAVGRAEQIFSYVPTGNAQIHASRGRLGKAAIALGIDAASLLAGGAAGKFVGSLIGRAGATMGSRILIGGTTGAIAGGTSGFVQGSGQTYLNTGDVGYSLRMGGSLAATGALFGGMVGGIVSAPAPRTFVTNSIGDLRAAAMKDAHHVVQDAAVRNLPGYDTNAARGVQLPGPSTARGTPHYNATQVQRLRGGGTYAAERRIGYRALRRAGWSETAARQAIQEADAYFRGIGVGMDTPTRIPGNR